MLIFPPWLASLPCRARGRVDGRISSFLLGIFLRLARVLCFGNIVFFGPSQLKMSRLRSLFFTPRLRVRAEGGGRSWRRQQMFGTGCVPHFAGLICPRRLYDLKFSSFHIGESGVQSSPAPAKSRRPPPAPLHFRFPRAVITLQR